MNESGRKEGEKYRTKERKVKITNIVKILWSMTVDGVCIDDGSIRLFDTARDYTSQFTITHTRTLVSAVTSSLAVAW
jgi:hypothetical protein